jgi:thymidylate synthase (FAD)
MLLVLINGMKIQRIELSGELGIVNAARVSFGKWKANLDDTDKKLIQYLKDHNHWTPFAHPQVICLFAFDDDIQELMGYYDKLLFAGIEIADRYVRFSLYSYNQIKDKLPPHAIINNPNDKELLELIKEYGIGKMSRIPYMQFRIKAPIFVVRQLDKHQIGMVKNEKSGRYVKTDPEFWQPKKWRKQSFSNKQGSIPYTSIAEKWATLNHKYLDYHDILLIINDWYKNNVENGMCAEQARTILPLSTYTEFVWTGSLQDFVRICNLRLKPDAQQETRECVQAIYDLCMAEYPTTFDLIAKFL